MKVRRLLCCLLSAVVYLSVQSSTLSCAIAATERVVDSDGIELDEYYVSYEPYNHDQQIMLLAEDDGSLDYNMYNRLYYSSGSSFSNAGTIGGKLFTSHTYDNTFSQLSGAMVSDYYEFTGNMNFREDIIFRGSNYHRLFEKDDIFDLEITGIINYVDVFNYQDTNSPYQTRLYFKTPKIKSITIIFMDSNNTYHDVSVATSSYSAYGDSTTFNLNINALTAPCDVYSFYVRVLYDTFEGFNVPSMYENFTFVKHRGFNNSSIRFDWHDYEAGLLETIINWVTSIWESITNLPGNIASSISGFFELVVTAVTDLGTFIIDGIKSLFVPEDLDSIFDDYNELLEERFGALYQVVAIFADFVSNINNVSAESSIYFPSVTVNLAGSDFTLGGWDIVLIPDGFAWLQNLVRTLVSIVFTVAFLNALKGRFIGLFGKEDNQ